MATLNHTNLTSYNVPALKEFFCRVFDFQVLDERGDKLAVLRNSDGFLLTLMYDKRMTPEHGYPGMFHIGFLQPTQQAVDLMHEALQRSALHGAHARQVAAWRTGSLRLLLPGPRRCTGGSEHHEHCRICVSATT